MWPENGVSSISEIPQDLADLLVSVLRHPYSESETQYSHTNVVTDDSIQEVGQGGTEICNVDSANPAFYGALIDKKGIDALLKLFHVVQPLYKMEQKLLLNLCDSTKTREDLVKVMMDLLVSGNGSNDSESTRLYVHNGYENNVTYSYPGVPPLVSWRILESLTYIARKNPVLAKLLTSDGEQIYLKLLLRLLKQPLYFGVAHLEQLLNLLDVVIDNVKVNSNQSDDPEDHDSASNTEMGGDNISVGTSFGAYTGNIAQRIFNDLSKPDLQLLCSVIAHEGLSDHSYNLISKVVTKLGALVPKHCHIFIYELTDLADKKLKSFKDGESLLISSNSTNGAPVVQTLSSLVLLLNEKDRESQLLGDKEHNVTIGALCKELSECIRKIEEIMTQDSASSSADTSTLKAPLPAGACNVLPYLKSFFVISGKFPGPLMEEDDIFLTFSKKHKKILNAFIRQQPNLLQKSFASMLKVPGCVDLENKIHFFRSEIMHQSGIEDMALTISVKRDYIFEDSFNQLSERLAQGFKGVLVVEFEEEEGIDQGGLTREWYHLLSRKIFDKNFQLFPTLGDASNFQPNPKSNSQDDLSHFQFVGRIVGRALIDSELLGVSFTRSFYKHILGIDVTYYDFKDVDPDYFRNLELIKNEEGCVSGLTFSFSGKDEHDQVFDYDLIPNGINISVTEENKLDFVKLLVQYRLTDSIQDQIQEFQKGFYDTIPQKLISIFDVDDMKLLINGISKIDVNDLMQNTEYEDYTADSDVVRWFWELVLAFDENDKACLVQFVTGTPKVPFGGFSELRGTDGPQKFTIQRGRDDTTLLPVAHTCFNQLDIPEYDSKEKLEEKLLLAIREGSEGFGFG